MSNKSIIIPVKMCIRDSVCWAYVATSQGFLREKSYPFCSITWQTTSRTEATKIWVKSYFGNNRWDIKILDPDENIPDSLMFEGLGNRKPVLFVEGERGSYDNQLYPFVYSNYNICLLYTSPKYRQY